MQTQDHHHLLSDGEPTSSPLPSASGLSFAGFCFPLLQAMFGVGGQPAIRQQSLQGSRVTRGDGRNPAQYIGQVRPHVHAGPPGALHQRVEYRSRLAAMLASEKQIILSTDGDWPQ